MTLAHLLVRQARQSPDRPAILHGTHVHATYGEWAARSAGLAQRLRGAGLVPGDRVLLFMRNHPRYLEVLWAAWWAGLVVLPVNAKLHRSEAEWIVDDAQARFGFVTQDTAPEPLAGLQRQIDVESAETDAWFEPAADAMAIPVAERDPDDVAWLFYTSGTTGRPKGVMITQRNLMTMGLAYHVDVDAVSPQDAMVYAAPMSHGAGLYAVPHLMAGARHVVPASGGVDPAELFALGAQVGPLSTFAAPTIVKRLVDHAEHAGLNPEAVARAFKTIVYGGAPMYVADIQRALRVMGPRFVQIYGQGETPMVGTALSREHLADTAHPRHLERIASVGVAQSPVRLRIADEAGCELPAGTVGEVLVKRRQRDGRLLAQPGGDGQRHPRRLALHGRRGQPRRRRLSHAEGPQQGPHHQRRLEHLPARGGRGAAHGAGRRGSGRGGPAGRRVGRSGGGVRGGARRRRGDPSTALDAHCLAHIARFKRPKRYEMVDALPKNNYGKVLKTELRARLLSGPPPRSATPPA